MYDGGGVRVGKDQEAARQLAVAKADAWTVGQAARLDTSPEEILDAVRRGWLPENIERVSSKYQLEDHPPLCDEIRQGIERIRRAPILPVHNTERGRRFWITRAATDHAA